jgi:hypothetical protein
VAGEPPNGALKERADGVGSFGLEDFDVGQAGAVIDADMHELPARAARGAAAPAALAGDAVPDAGDPPELLDVDVDELARPRAFIAVLGLIGVRAWQAPFAMALEHRRGRRVRHPERLGDLGRRKAQLAQRQDRLHALRRRPIGHPLRRRGTVLQAVVSLLAEALEPLARRALADARCRRGVSD